MWFGCKAFQDLAVGGNGCVGYRNLITQHDMMLMSNWKRPHRLVVRTSRCGRDNPGSAPGVDKVAAVAPLNCVTRSVRMGGTRTRYFPQVTKRAQKVVATMTPE